LEELITSGDIEAVKLFIAQGGDVNAQSEGSLTTPLHCAAMKGQKDIVKMLLAVEGIHVDAKGGWFDGTPLHYVAKGGYKEIVELLVKSDADINTKDRQGKTPLDYARQLDKQEIIELLKKHGAKE
jgi:ankyrin repeat protein